MLIPSLALMDVPETEFAEGDEIITQGTPGAQVFVLIKGTVGVWVNGSHICDIDKPGAVFGEISALLARNHTASVRANGPVKFFVVEDLPTFIRHNPDISVQLLKIMSERLVNMNTELTKLREKSWWKFWW